MKNEGSTIALILFAMSLFCLVYADATAIETTANLMRWTWLIFVLVALVYVMADIKKRLMDY